MEPGALDFSAPHDPGAREQDINISERMSVLTERKYTCRVSSTLNRDTKQFGKKFLFDNREETCWNSDQVDIIFLDKCSIFLNNEGGIRYLNLKLYFCFTKLRRLPSKAFFNVQFA